MQTIILALIVGLLTGRLIRLRRAAIWLSRCQTWFMPTLLVMIFFLSLSVATHHLTINNYFTIFRNALLMAIAGMAGSIIVATTMQKYFNDRLIMASKAVEKWFNTERRSQTNIEKPAAGMSSSQLGIAITVSFCSGIIVRWLQIPWLSDADLINLGKTLSLIMIMILVGITVGSDRRTMRLLRFSGPCILILPAAIIIGTWLGGAAVLNFLHGVQWQQALSITSGLGFYSASSSIIGKLAGPVLGLTALIVNLLREFITMVLAPHMARLFGPVGLIACGGATTMNSTLPLVSMNSSKEYVVMAFCSGLILTLLVPLMVTLLIQF